MTFSRQLQVVFFVGVAASAPVGTSTANELMLAQQVLRVPEAARVLAESLLLFRNGVGVAPYGFLNGQLAGSKLTFDDVAAMIAGLPGRNEFRFDAELPASHLRGIQPRLKEILARHLQATLRFAPNIERLDDDPRLPEYLTAADDRILRRLMAARMVSSEDRAGQVGELSDGALAFLSDKFGLNPFRALLGKPVAMQAFKLPSVEWFETKLKGAETGLSRAMLFSTTHGWIEAHLKKMGISAQNEGATFPAGFIMDSQTAAELGTIYIRSSEIAAELVRRTNFEVAIEVAVDTPPAATLSQEFAREALRRYEFVSAVLHSPDLKIEIRTIDEALVSRVLREIAEMEAHVSIGNPEWEATVAMVRDLNLPEAESLLSEWLSMDQSFRRGQNLQSVLHDWFKRAHRALNARS